MSPAIFARTTHLFKPRDAYRIDWSGGFGGGGGGSPRGANPPSGATVYYNLDRANQVVTLDFLDAQGAVIRSFTSNPDSLTLADSLRADERRAARRDSLTRAGLSADSVQKLLAAPAEGAGQGSGGGGGGGEGGGPGGGGPRPPRVPNKAGLNTFSWNLRYPDAVRFENIIMWAASTNGPIAPPGTYRVRMRVGGQSLTESF